MRVRVPPGPLVQRNKRLSLVRHIAFSFYFALPVCLLVEDSSYPRKQMKHLLTGLPDYNSLRSFSASPSGPTCAKKQAIVASATQRFFFLLRAPGVSTRRRLLVSTQAVEASAYRTSGLQLASLV